MVAIMELSTRTRTPLIGLGPDLDERAETDTAQRTALQIPWHVVVWDDPVNLMSWVTWVFRTHFGFSQAKAHALMLEVHESGRAIVAEGTLEEAERHVAALHGYGLMATYERAGGGQDADGGRS
jgi:ATP-dependent Clp protease adaptor protein ClpS